ncbi:hypothetical protein GLOIN_2v1847750 [Rhizophagus irregularis DAOM 181602=DAOM 197198]|uniref:Uncharacterized protein n=1 Tax=Rhizophagus irregularis (strain DAOM 181602 / DAOM 197198 / MUCL 43194) TaxID=747089 RepID=A0A2P4P442_RHIID|nr:hypothetical protein GLOIN_2v1847750 [Rhizophagus irregularis DAOM 181602=DAOM 197198]POG60156.1 hypothetical protein GLOIN_2v1847750 [Rhizophagus irregularis DAOM 181602=DAOM 197198]|eukprot:XP_025167022.1 hypothetical protein GLOIN_2v1847750 [Rhizophagus irregularis DAOM 181602=DAOM 197198]
MPVVIRMEMWSYKTLHKEMVKQLFRTTSICVESLELLIDKLDGELKSFVAIIENAIQKQEPEYGIQSCDMYPGKSVFFGIVFQICINKAFVYLDFIVNSILHQVKPSKIAKWKSKI